jgi:hypothetical protein
VTRQLNNRLDQPEFVAIDRTGGRTVIASTRGPQYTFEADGQARTEQGPGGQSITTRASVYGDQLNVTTTGMANNEFRVTFEPLRGGQELRVTRLLYNDALARPVSLQTIYRRTSETPDWDLYNRPATGRGTRPAGNTGNAGIIVPDGTVLSARLDQTVNLRQAREEDRITLTVHNAPRPNWKARRSKGTSRAISRRSMSGPASLCSSTRSACATGARPTSTASLNPSSARMGRRSASTVSSPPWIATRAAAQFSAAPWARSSAA